MLQTTANNFRNFLRKKSIAYNRVFDRNNLFTRDVLTDLAKFCRAHETTFHPDARLNAALEGRREVWLRIQGFLNLTNAELYDLHRIREVERE